LRSNEESFGMFEFRYRLNQGAPLVRKLTRDEAAELTAGDVVCLHFERVSLAATGDDLFLGAVREGAWPPEVIGDADAVYAVADPYPRTVGALLDLTGGSGAQGVAPGPNGDFEVVVDCSAEEETLVRITLGKHCDFTASLGKSDNGGTGGFRGRLGAEQERRLVAAAAAGDTAAREKLVEAFLPAIAAVARLYRGSATVERAELLQSGVVGLLRALKRYEPALGTPFWAYAAWWVRQAMQQLVSEVTRPAVLSDRAQRALARLVEARRDHLREHGRGPSVDELAQAANLPRALVGSLLAIERAPRGLEEPLDGGEEAGMTVGDLIRDPIAEEDLEAVMARMELEQVRDLTADLGERERSILLNHYGIGRPAKTLREIGETIGVTAERVRQIEEGTLAGLRQALVTGAV
jgi:RNA polymerase sigma factor (sigma-70 family)